MRVRQRDAHHGGLQDETMKIWDERDRRKALKQAAICLVILIIIVLVYTAT